ncbi:hypothetical protein ABTW76_06345 [Paenibacillus dendritiformis]
MFRYKLFKYDYTGDEKFIIESEDEKVIEQEALLQSLLDNRYTYRIETWNDEEWVGRNRFFHEGEDLTQKIINSILNTYFPHTPTEKINHAVKLTNKVKSGKAEVTLKGSWSNRPKER